MAKNKAIQIGLLGASGRMGQQIIKLIQTEYSQKARLHSCASQGDDLALLLEAQVIIDFSLPEAAVKLSEILLKSKNKTLPALVIGSTGWSGPQKEILHAVSRKTPVLVSTNFSTGVLAFQEILKTAAPLLKKLGYTPVIVETHHKNKKDAPSGTATTLQEIIDPKNPKNVQTHSLRAGEIIGHHEITFFGSSDRITLGHFASDRTIFARGAIDAALWLNQKKPNGKILTMKDYFHESFF